MAGVNLWEYVEGLANVATLNDVQRRTILTDELLAQLTTGKSVFRRLANEFVGAVRNWLRTHSLQASA